MDPEFYQLMRTLEAYRRFLDEKTTVLLSADSELLKFLSGPPAACRSQDSGVARRAPQPPNAKTDEATPSLAAAAGLAGGRLCGDGFLLGRAGQARLSGACGRVLPGVRMPGLHFGLPYGIDRLAKVKIEEQGRSPWGSAARAATATRQKAAALRRWRARWKRVGVNGSPGTRT